mmetsp:Transcript_6910/g.7900  ORF Transcript_6910/g.7900 Transcript_6910/m.7900 type:complete len:331 (-) Transcript_6910:729-1721(-)|eukprot:CAMPEP_0197855016 /NCGR_PEP_ID=MMETSP1438-20131217/25806_1 /TAXON_ID=1461541 /ORGANISM="Pterosperma sp., Strain CCMP1384" /LENGTH=330 /DNA_ID=CAMNT_0043469981 /DNA_START=63 /DNA_END=1055 /DNA_ORIENTATION=-
MAQGVGGNAELEGLVLVAAIDGNAKELARLLEQGADPNETDRKYGNTPLIEAATSGCTDCIAVLLKANQKVTVDAQNLSGNTALHEACYHGQYACVRQLLLAHSNHSILNQARETPLHVAATEGRTKCMEFLLWSGVDPRTQNNKGLSAIDIVHRCKNEKVKAGMLAALDITAPAQPTGQSEVDVGFWSEKPEANSKPSTPSTPVQHRVVNPDIDPDWVYSADKEAREFITDDFRSDSRCKSRERRSGSQPPGSMQVLEGSSSQGELQGRRRVDQKKAALRSARRSLSRNDSMTSGTNGVRCIILDGEQEPDENTNDNDAISESPSTQKI